MKGRPRKCLASFLSNNLSESTLTVSCSLDEVGVGNSDVGDKKRGEKGIPNMSPKLSHN